jgi:hypothetical protein
MKGIPSIEVKTILTLIKVEVVASSISQIDKVRVVVVMCVLYKFSM